jgi:hypothetical protein
MEFHWRWKMNSIGLVNLNIAFVLLMLGLSASCTPTINGCEIKPGTECSRADLENALLINANLSGANLSGADLSGAFLSGAIFLNTTCPDGSNSDDNGNTC